MVKMDKFETSLAAIITSPGFTQRDPEPQKKGFSYSPVRLLQKTKPNYGDRFFSDQGIALRTSHPDLRLFRVIPFIKNHGNDFAENLNTRIQNVNDKIGEAETLLQQIWEDHENLEVTDEIKKIVGLLVEETANFRSLNEENRNQWQAHLDSGVAHEYKFGKARELKRSLKRIEKHLKNLIALLSVKTPAHYTDKDAPGTDSKPPNRVTNPRYNENYQPVRPTNNQPVPPTNNQPAHYGLPKANKRLSQTLDSQSILREVNKIRFNMTNMQMVPQAIPLGGLQISGFGFGSTKKKGGDTPEL